MKLENILIIGGLGFIAYWMIKKSPRIIDVPDIKAPQPDPKTIVLNLNNTRGKVGVLSSNVEKRYNASEFATTSPASVVIGNQKKIFYDF